MIEAILAGERDKHKLLSLCHQSIIKRKADQVLKALEGYYTPVGLFTLQQAYDAYRFYQQQITDCDQAIEQVLEETHTDLPEPKGEKRKPIRHHKPKVDRLGDHLLYLFSSRDATVISGITDYSWFQLYTEIGNQLSRWPTEKHFTSWLGLSPGNTIRAKRNATRRRAAPRRGNSSETWPKVSWKAKTLPLGPLGEGLGDEKDLR